MISTTTASPGLHNHYDVVIAGARCAGASTALLLAKQGLRVLVVDPARRGSDTLSTHALMRGGVLQLHRWGVLDAIRSAQTPPIRTTTFHYGDEEIEVQIKERDGVDALYAPRRTVLDAVLLDAAEVAGADVRCGLSVAGLLRDRHDRVTGVRVTGAGADAFDVSAGIVIGADGLRSRVATLVGADLMTTAAHATASIYGYHRDLGLEGFHWFYQVGGAVGSIPTNNGDTCVFASLPPDRFQRGRKRGLKSLFGEVLESVSPLLSQHVAAADPTSKLRAFAGHPGFLRRATGSGWALVGDAAYFKDPLTAHGITDALRDAELLARAIIEGGDDALARYQSTRDELVRGLFNVTDQIASFDWDLETVKEYHFQLSKEMNTEVDVVRSFDSSRFFIDNCRFVVGVPAILGD